MDSTTAVPPIRDPIDKPVSVITVIMIFFNTSLYKITLSLIPLDLAPLTYPLSNSSMTAVLI